MMMMSKEEGITAFVSTHMYEMGRCTVKGCPGLELMNDTKCKKCHECFENINVVVVVIIIKLLNAPFVPSYPTS